MKSKFVWIGATTCALAAMTLAGCGDDTPGSQAGYQGDGSDRCSDQLIQDYNNIVDEAKAGVDPTNDINNFANTYKGDVCTADENGNRTTITVDSQVQTWRSQLEGSCSEQFLSDYNSTVTTVSQALTSGSQSQLTQAQQVVQQFGMEYSGVTCNAQDTASGTTETIVVSDRVTTWDNAIQQAITLLAPPTPTPAPPVVPTPEPSVVPSPIPAPSPAPLAPVGSLVSSFPDGFQLLISDSATLSAEVAANVDTSISQVLQNGRVVPADSMVNTVNTCSVSSFTGAKVPANGSTVTFGTVIDQGTSFEANTTDWSLYLNCIRNDGKGTAGTPSFTLADLNAIFGNLAVATQAP